MTEEELKVRERALLILLKEFGGENNYFDFCLIFNASKNLCKQLATRVLCCRSVEFCEVLALEVIFDVKLALLVRRFSKWIVLIIYKSE